MYLHQNLPGRYKRRTFLEVVIIMIIADFLVTKLQEPINQKTTNQTPHLSPTPLNPPKAHPARVARGALRRRRRRRGPGAGEARDGPPGSVLSCSGGL